MFAIIILSKSNDGEEFGRVEWVWIGLRTSIVDILCIKPWSGVLIWATFVFVSAISIYLVRVYFPIFFYKVVSSKVKSVIISGYIAVCGEILERSISVRILYPKLLLPLAFCK